MTVDNQPVLVQALYSFKGKNNDELCFKKGDIITVTQHEEGGWWEGTLNDDTGWFPSNYVKEIRQSEPDSRVDADMFNNLQYSQQHHIYKNMVLKDTIESEKQHVKEMNNLRTEFLGPLLKSDILSELEYKQLVGNLDEVNSLHECLLSSMEAQFNHTSREQKIGSVFLNMASLFYNALKQYCSNHPYAVCILEKYREELNGFIDGQGAQRPGIMFLTTGLSKPFRRFDRYSGMLQEYQRHLEEGHPDRGNTQRAALLFQEYAASCSSIRRQKELELEVVTGHIHGWDDGDNLSVLGEVIFMGSVALLPDNRDRYFVLFPSWLVLLAVSPRMSTFIFEVGVPVNTRSSTCQSVYAPQNKVWSLSCLRPSPPLCPGFSAREDKRTQKNRRKDEKWYEDDTMLLRVIEAYCTSAKTRYTVNSAILDNPQLIIAEEEKIIVEETRGNHTVVEEKSLVDTVYSLKEQITSLKKDQLALWAAFHKEFEASAKLRSLIKQNLYFGSDDIKLQLGS